MLNRQDNQSWYPADTLQMSWAAPDHGTGGKVMLQRPPGAQSLLALLPVPTGPQTTWGIPSSHQRVLNVWVLSRKRKAPNASCKSHKGTKQHPNPYPLQKRPIPSLPGSSPSSPSISRHTGALQTLPPGNLTQPLPTAGTCVAVPWGKSQARRRRGCTEKTFQHPRPILASRSQALPCWVLAALCRQREPAPSTERHGAAPPLPMQG